jgi:hypothetical protein
MATEWPLRYRRCIDMRRISLAAAALLSASCAASAVRDEEGPVAHVPRVDAPPPRQLPSSAGDKVGNGDERPLDLRKVRWRDRSYDFGNEERDGELFSGRFDVKGGEHHWDRGGGDRGWFMVSKPSFGDVDGDRRDEALVVATLNTGGSGQFSLVLLFRSGTDGPVRIGSIGGGDRAHGGVRSVAIDRQGRIALERNFSDQGACCPSHVDHELWRWDGSSLVELEAERRRVALPSTP